MSYLAFWVKRVRKRSEGKVCVEEAAVANRFFPYLYWRMRGVLGTRLAVLAVLVVEFLFFRGVLGQSWLTRILLLQQISGAFVVIWWGGLELYREKIRDLWSEGKKSEIACLMISQERWATFFSYGLVAAALIYLVFEHGIHGAPWHLVSTYLLALAIRVGLDIRIRTAHSAVFAIRRIYRPFYTIFLVDILQIVLSITLWYFIGVWAFSVAMLGASVVRFFVARYFIELSRQGLHLPETTFRGRRPLPFSFRAGFANLFIRSTSFIAIPFLLSQFTVEDEVPLGNILHLAGPLLAVSFDWAFLFYFDLTWFRQNGRGILAERMLQSMNRWALPLGLFFYATATGVLAMVLDRPDYGFLLSLLPFFVIRALVAPVWVSWFAAHDWRAIFLRTIPILFALPVILLSSAPAVWKLGAIGLLQLFYFLGSNRSWSRFVSSRLSLNGWISTIRTVKPVEVWKFCLFRGGKGDSRGPLVKNLEKFLEISGAIWSMPSDNTVVVAFSKDARIPDMLSLAVATGGRIHHFEKVPVESDEQLIQFVRKLVKPTEVPIDLGKAFSKFTTGLRLSQVAPVPEAFLKIPYGIRKSILRAALSLNSDTRKEVLRLGYDLVAWDPKGDVQEIFVVPISMRNGFGEFRQQVRDDAFLRSIQ